MESLASGLALLVGELSEYCVGFVVSNSGVQFWYTVLGQWGMAEQLGNCARRGYTRGSTRAL